MLYDLAFGPRNPRPPRTHNIREWEDPMAWVDLLLDAPRQVAANISTSTAPHAVKVKSPKKFAGTNPATNLRPVRATRIELYRFKRHVESLEEQLRLETELCKLRKRQQTLEVKLMDLGRRQLAET